MEIWKDISGYEGIYQVSTLGRVKSLERKVIKRGKLVRRSGVILAPWRGHYLHVNLCKDRVRVRCKVHALVGDAFIPNPDNKPILNHIDSNTYNNTVDNLEWCTLSENSHHGYYHGRKKKCIEAANKATSKAVVQINNRGDMVGEFSSMSEAARINNIRFQGVSNACNNSRNNGNKYKGHRWLKKSDYMSSPGKSSLGSELISQA